MTNLHAYVRHNFISYNIFSPLKSIHFGGNRDSSHMCEKCKNKCDTRTPLKSPPKGAQTALARMLRSKRKRVLFGVVGGIMPELKLIQTTRTYMKSTQTNWVQSVTWKQAFNPHWASAKTRKRTRVYFAHPYSSYERGSNENANRLIRRFLPKGSTFDKLRQRDVQKLARWMNKNPRKLFAGMSAKDKAKEIGLNFDYTKPWVCIFFHMCPKVF